MTPKAASRNAGLAMTVLANLLWGTVFVASSVGLTYADPYLLVFLRFVTVTIGVILVSVALGSTRDVAHELSRKVIWALGTIYALGFLIQYVGQNVTNAADATLLSNLAPALMILLDVHCCWKGLRCPPNSSAEEACRRPS